MGTEFDTNVRYPQLTKVTSTRIELKRGKMFKNVSHVGLFGKNLNFAAFKDDTSRAMHGTYVRSFSLLRADRDLSNHNFEMFSSYFLPKLESFKVW